MRPINLTSVILALSTFQSVSAQTDTAPSSSAALQANCTSWWENANATGTFGFISLYANDGSPDDLTTNATHNTSSQNITWSMTVNSPGHPEEAAYYNAYQTDFWLGTPPGVNFDNGSNPYSACAFQFGALPENTLRRGQKDDGSCEQTFSKDCVLALTDKAALIAQYLTSDYTPGPYSNLTPPVLGGICGIIQAGLGQANVAGNAFPSACRPYFDDGTDQWPSSNAVAITSNQTSDKTCRLSPSLLPDKHTLTTPFSSYLSYATTNATTNAALYANLTQGVYPILTVFMPAANNSRGETITTGEAHLTCVRAMSYSNGSTIPPALPVGKAVGSGLSKGAIAGIVISCLVGVGLILALGYWFMRRRREKRRAEAGTLNGGDGKTGVEKDGGNLAEKDAGGMAHQLHDTQVLGEIDGEPGRVSELAGAEIPIGEMEGSMPRY